MAPPHRQLKNIRNPTPRPSGAFSISRASCNASVGAGFYPARSSTPLVTLRRGRLYLVLRINREAVTTGPMWASAPTECLPIGFRRGRCPHRPAPGLAQSSLSSIGADASVRPLPNAPPQKRERPPGRSHLAYVFFTPPGNRPGLRPPAAGFSPGPAHPGAGR